jgi:RNA polymerase sigma-70 factor (ECF subfamily)
MGFGARLPLYRERRLEGHSVSSVQLRQTPNPSAGPDRQAGRLFEEYSDRIYGFCLHRLGSPSDAEDAVQTTFLYAHRALQRGVAPESESAWLYTIAKNVCRSQRRTLGRRPTSSDVDVDSFASPQRDADEQETVQGLENALASIPEKQRRALLLREWRGLTSSEVASQLGMSGPATYALLTRARRSLVQAMTAPSMPALGIASLLYELRSKLKALLGGFTAKGATTAAVAVVVTVGGVSTGGAMGSDRPAPQVPASAPEQPTVDSALHPASVAGGTGVAAREPSASVVRRGSAPRARLEDGVIAPTAVAAAEPGSPPVVSGTSTDPGTGTSARGESPGKSLEDTIPELELPPAPDLELPPVPDLDLPPLPDLEVPPLPDLGLPVEVPGELPLDPAPDPDAGLPVDLPTGPDAPEPPAVPDIPPPDVLP